ncbi:MAG TPA: AraC family transcriptional regulator [Streptosporangiaceae bacterium]
MPGHADDFLQGKPGHERWPIGAIAKEIGYTSQFAFANAFKRTFGTAPGRYRRVSRHEVAASVT